MKQLLSISGAILLFIMLQGCKKETSKRPEMSENIKIHSSIMRLTGPNYTAEYTSGNATKFYKTEESGNNIKYEMDFLNGQNTALKTININSIFNSVTGVYTFIYWDGETVIETHSFPTITYPGDSRKLGGRRPGEDYSDCFQRNWDNFCCDAVGCLAIASNPHVVALAIGASCIFRAIPTLPADYDLANIQNITNNMTGTPIY